MGESDAAADYVRVQIPILQSKKPLAGIVCGSGLGGLASHLVDASTIAYSAIPNFPTTSVIGHAGQLAVGLLNGCLVICLAGRFHYYEGHPVAIAAFPIRVLYKLGVGILIVTNAAGGLNPHFSVGDIMLIEDHISLPGLSGLNPLVGNNINEISSSNNFVPMSDVYDIDLRRKAAKAAELSNLRRGGRGENKDGASFHEGIYCFVGGPSYETRAEARFLHAIGGDVVGMSTVPEVIMARKLKMRVLGLSLITNIVDTGITSVLNDEALSNTSVRSPPPSHIDILLVSKERAEEMRKLVTRFVSLISAE